MHAIVITPLGEARDVDRHHEAIRHRVAGHPDQSLYHREALLRIHGNGGCEGLRSNLLT